MGNEADRILQLHMQGFHCAQILLMLGLEHQHKENPDLIRAMDGLSGAGGLNFSGKNCGALIGGACLLALFGGRGTVEESGQRALPIMIQQLPAWFEAGFGAQYGGIDCDAILQNDPWNRLTRCPKLVNDTFFMARQLLKENGLAFQDEETEEVF